MCRSPRFFVKIMMFFCFCKDCNDVIARVVTNLNLITACYSPQKEPHYDTVPEQEDSRPRFVFTHHHFHHFFWIWWNFLPLSYKAIVNILRHFLFQVMRVQFWFFCGRTIQSLRWDAMRSLFQCHTKPHRQPWLIDHVVTQSVNCELMHPSWASTSLSTPSSMSAIANLGPSYYCNFQTHGNSSAD